MIINQYLQLSYLTQQLQAKQLGDQPSESIHQKNMELNELK